MSPAWEDVADALGAMPEAFNVFDITDEATTFLASMPVEGIADALEPTVTRLLAEAEERGAAKVREAVLEVTDQRSVPFPDKWKFGAQANYVSGYTAAVTAIRAVVTAEADSAGGESDE